MLKIDEKLHLKPRNSSPKGGLHVQADTQNVTPLNGPPESCTIPEKVSDYLNHPPIKQLGIVRTALKTTSKEHNTMSA